MYTWCRLQSFRTALVKIILIEDLVKHWSRGFFCWEDSRQESAFGCCVRLGSNGPRKGIVISHHVSCMFLSSLVNFYHYWCWRAGGRSTGKKPVLAIIFSEIPEISQKLLPVLVLNVHVPSPKIIMQMKFPEHFSCHVTKMFTGINLTGAKSCHVIALQD